MPRAQVVRVEPELAAGGVRRERVGEVVVAGRPERDAVERVGPDVRDTGAGRHGDDPASGAALPLGQGGGAVVVDAADEEPVGVDRVGELVERRGVGLVGPPVVEVVGLDVGDDRGVRPVDQEGAVALVGLGDEQVARALGGVDAGRGEVAADGVRRVGARGLERDGEQRGGRGLAVGARRRRPPGGRPSARRAPPTAAAPAGRGATASTYSGLSSRTAVETTRVSPSPRSARWAASWPTWTDAPERRAAPRGSASRRRRCR